MIETLFSVEPVADWRERVVDMSRQARRAPFSDDSIRFVASLSQQILSSALARRMPELAALAHWFRPASLARMKAELFQSAGTQGLRPRGCAFLIAPANVDILFIYGWLLSLLAGNATVVRVSQKPSEARDEFLKLVGVVGADERYRDLLRDSAIVSYPHDSEMNRLLSEWCDLRLIWGGDATVNAIRAIPLKPSAVEGGFADRFSMAAFDARSILEEPQNRLAELARRFANDTLWFSQQACSSPRMVFWIGKSGDIAAAKSRFWPLFREAARHFEDEPAALMSRVNDIFSMAAGGLLAGVGEDLAQVPSRAEARSKAPAIRQLHSGFGLFVEYELATLSELALHLTDKDQTLVVHGIPSSEISHLLDNLPNRALDRIVPVGQATDFNVTWDGINLMDIMTRRVALPRVAG